MSRSLIDLYSDVYLAVKDVLPYLDNFAHGTREHHDASMQKLRAAVKAVDVTRSGSAATHLPGESPGAIDNDLREQMQSDSSPYAKK